MDESCPQRRRFQFSLRKMFLWTLVLALYLAVIKCSCPTMKAHAVFGVALTVLWIGGVGLLRALVSPGVAALSSVAAGPLVVGYLGYLVVPTSSGKPAVMVAAILLGLEMGGLMFVITDILVCVVNLVDRYIEKKAGTTAND